ncbi:MAG: hypothetical protein IKY92_02910 [Akkermansia sp.]|nr:hypothetical protein [Akkermansia sp.]
MKRFSLLFAVAALCGLPHASAVSADYAQAELKMKPNDAQVEQIVPRAEYFSTKENAKAVNPAWHYVRIPYILEGKCRDASKLPLYVDELKVHAYLVFSVGKDGDKLIMLDKEITYVNIPLSPKSDRSENKNVQAAVFISPSDAARICADDSNKVEKVDLKDKLAAVAVEFTFKDSSCMKPDTQQDVLVNKKLKNRLKAKWWTREDKAGIGAKLSAISETPFAPFYAPSFPPTSPMYGSAAESYKSAAPSTPGYVPSAATDSASTTDASGADTDEAQADSKKKSKKRRK